MLVAKTQIPQVSAEVLQALEDSQVEPGSPEARSIGCTCPIEDGIVQLEFHCPYHGCAL